MLFPILRRNSDFAKNCRRPHSSACYIGKLQQREQLQHILLCFRFLRVSVDATCSAKVLRCPPGRWFLVFRGSYFIFCFRNRVGRPPPFVCPAVPPPSPLRPLSFGCSMPHPPQPLNTRQSCSRAFFHRFPVRG